MVQACYIRLFGSPRVTLPEQDLPILSDPVALLLGYLALHAAARRPVSRSKLAGVLFPDASEAQARRQLSDTVYRLRRLLGPYAETILQTDGLHLRLGPVAVDVHEFQAHAAGPGPAEWRAAIDLYAGPLLQDLDADWLPGPRAGLEETYLRLLSNTCAACTAAGNFPTALDYAQRWIAADPLSEEAHQAAMRLYARLGRYAAALQDYHALVRLYGEELQAQPLPATRSLARSIRAELAARAEAQGTPPRPAFVGRQAERGAFLECVEAAQASRGGLLLLEGEPGAGKTRLLEEVAEAAAWRGLAVAWGRAEALAGQAPYAPLGDALQTALASPRREQVQDRLSPDVRTALEWLFTPQHRGTAGPLLDLLRSPGVAGAAPMETTALPQGLGAAGIRAKPGLAAEGAPGHGPDVAAALAECLAALAGISPLLLLLDDVQWARPDFWEVLAALAGQLGGQRMLLVLSYRPGELRARPEAWEALLNADRAAAPRRLSLAGLTPGDTAELAAAEGLALDRAAAADLCARTGGNPLLIHEALAQRGEAGLPFAGLLRQRLALLSSAERDALEACAVLGREFAHDAWQALAGRSLLDAIPGLVAARFITETEHGYLLQHDLVREHIYNAIPVERRRELHSAAAAALARDRAGPDALAWHYEQAEQWPEAVCFHYGAGDRAFSAFAYATALEHYNCALDLAPRLARPEVARLALLVRRQRVLGLLLRMPAWRADTEEITRLAVDQEDPRALLAALEAQITIQVMDGSAQGLQATGMQALNLARRLDDRAAEARIASDVARHLSSHLGVVTGPFFERALAVAESLYDPALLVAILCSLATNYVHAGHCGQARAQAARALAIIESQPDLAPLRPRALEQLGIAAGYLAEYEVAYNTLRQVLPQAIALGKLWEAGETAIALAYTCVQLGRSSEARETLEYMLTLADHSGVNTATSDAGYQLKAHLALAYIEAGDLATAEGVLENAGAHLADAEVTYGSGQIFALWGLLHLTQGEPTAARPWLERAAAAVPPGHILSARIQLYLAQAACRSGDNLAAQAALARAENLLAASDSRLYAVLCHFVHYELSGNEADLAAAEAEIRRQADQIMDPALRATFEGQVSLHRQIAVRRQALQARHPAPAYQTVRLARADAPLGRPLNDGERVELTWLVDAGEADAAILRSAGKVALRRHRIARLVAEAAARGAAPTDADLAAVLGVTERTIEGDIAALREQGQALATRRRQARAA